MQLDLATNGPWGRVRSALVGFLYPGIPAAYLVPSAAGLDVTFRLGAVTKVAHAYGRTLLKHSLRAAKLPLLTSALRKSEIVTWMAWGCPVGEQ